jgi:hypothetical protein
MMNLRIDSDLHARSPQAACANLSTVSTPSPIHKLSIVANARADMLYDTLHSLLLSK